MKYENNSRKVYLNNHNIPIVVKNSLTQVQKEKLDAVFGIGEILSSNEYKKFKDFIDFKNTRFLNLKQTVTEDFNTINIPSYEGVKERLYQQFDRDKYEFWFCDMNEVVKQSVPMRFKNLGLNISYFFDVFEIEFTNHSYKSLSPDLRIIGSYYSDKNKVDFLFPVFVFDKNEMRKNEKYNENFLRSFYIGFAFDSSYTLIHELKHAFNNHNMINVLKNKKISPYDRLRLYKYDEYSAEMEHVFYYIKQKEMLKNYIDIPSNFKYENVLRYVETHPDYFENMSEFVQFVKHEVEEKLLKANADIYNDDYYLKFVITQMNQYPNFFSNKSDEGVYDTLKKSSLSFEIFNPKTRETELVDLSSYFKDQDISAKEKYLLDKNFRKDKKMANILKKESKISNKTLKILKEELIR